MVAFLLPLTGACASFKRFAYEGWGRDRWQKPDEVIRSLALPAGAQIADLGAGGGYFTVRLAEAVGPSGKVYAVDVDEGMIEYAMKRASDGGLRNVLAVLAAPDDPRLPERALDLIFTCNTYHHLTDRAEYFARAKKHLRPGGRLAIIEYNGAGFLGRIFGHATPGETIREEVTAAGYRLEQELTFLPRQSFHIFALADS
jgi:arsenite methyltransferase